jgi:hypothetical protein
MQNDSDEEKEGKDWNDLIWVLVGCLAVLLLLALPAGLVWYTVQKQRAMRDAEMMRMEEAMREAEEERQRALQEKARHEAKPPQKATAREPAGKK